MAQRIYDRIEVVYALATIGLVLATTMILLWGSSVVWPFYIWFGAFATMIAGGVTRIFLRLFCGAEHYN